MEIMKNTVGNAEESSFSSSSASGANVALMSIKDLQKLCGENAKKSGWHADRPSVANVQSVDDAVKLEKELLHWQGMKIMLMVSELAEGVEELRAGNGAAETYYNAANGETMPHQVHVEGVPLFKPEGLPSELADTVIRILDFCHTEEIDLQSMIQEKLDFNQTRGIRHGGKAV